MSHRFPFLPILALSMGLLIIGGRLMSQSAKLAYQCEKITLNVAECRLKYFGR